VDVAILRLPNFYQNDHGANPMTGHETTAPAESTEPLFEDQELAQFDEDDTTAGRDICKMLSLFFLYTVIAMALVGYWTFGASTGG
jgi:hypothetical protein